MSALNAINIRQNGVITPFSKIGSTQKTVNVSVPKEICDRTRYAYLQSLDQNIRFCCVFAGFDATSNVPRAFEGFCTDGSSLQK